MREVCALAVAITMLAAAAPAPAMSANDKGDCEQVTNPGLKVAACTRILAGGSLPNDAQARSAIIIAALGYLLQQNFDRAIVEFNEALRADPANIRSLNSRGNAWRGKGELDNAIADYNAAIKLDPTFRLSLQRPRQRLRTTRASCDRAIEDYSQVIRLDPTLAAPYNNRALRIPRQGRLRPRAERRRGRAAPRPEERGDLFGPRRDLADEGRPRSRARRPEPAPCRWTRKARCRSCARGDTYRYRGDLDARARRLRLGAARHARLHPGLCRPRPDVRESRATSRAHVPNTRRR